MRIIHNTSFIINDEIETAWIDFMKTYYISTIRGCGLCSDIIFTKVSIGQQEDKTYSLQLVFDSFRTQHQFLESNLPDIEEKLITRYGNKYLYFSSTLTEI